MSGGIGRALLAAAVATAFPSWALWDDKLEVFAQENITRDSNVFRLPDDTDPCVAINSCSRDDTIYTTSLGFLFDIPYSLQRWQLSYTWYDARYQRFEDLDHDGHIARAAWLWALTPQLTGEISYNDQEGLASFANIQGRRPDMVTQRMALANAAWMMLPSWRLHAAATWAEARHTGEEQRVNDIELEALEAGISFVTATENRIGVAARVENGRNPNDFTVGGLLFNNEYEQRSAGIQARWVITGLSRLDGTLYYTKREYENFSDRNYSGPTFNLTHTWTPTGKFTMATILSRDIAPLEDVTSSFVLVTGITVRPDWAITEKINLRGHFAYARWEYFGVQPFQADYENRVKTAGATLMWRPTRRIALSGTLAREYRTSTLSNADYKVDTASVEARIGF
ncbi:MAG TPA: XrtB/PEP-CTERM-associated polysaccharide biosynthesis outer membrane protein EpsL [Usitatibacter sp.]|nr:XrtB/PEP-CTERM-associated polysaccharide biosynthesis outer membrane protein EpsL [Usitatibacter sp.]